MLAIGAISTAQAQFSWGIKAGVNLIEADFSNLESNIDTKNLTGFQVGPMIQFTVPVIGIGLDAAVLYSQTGFELKGENYKQGSLLIPVNFKYKLSLLGVLGAYATAGPYAKFKLDSDDLYEDAKAKSFGAGLNFGFGVEVLSHLQVGANYQVGLTDNYNESSALQLAGNSVNSKDKGWSITAAYLF
ncbi:membrane protein [Bacteroidia bacterium]|nr:membrane protein [Bacteroidia bacterium]